MTRLLLRGEDEMRRLVRRDSLKAGVEIVRRNLLHRAESMRGLHDAYASLLAAACAFDCLVLSAVLSNEISWRDKYERRALRA